MQTTTRAVIAAARTLALSAVLAPTATAQVPGLTGTVIVTNKTPATATIVVPGCSITTGPWSSVPGASEGPS